MVLYHVSDVINRDSILKHGLDHKMGVSPWFSPEDPIVYPKGNYFWKELRDARNYGYGLSEPMDIFQVEVDTELLVDPITDKGFYVTEPVPPGSVKLLQTVNTNNEMVTTIKEWKIILEAKSVGKLYHFTTIRSLLQIADDDTLGDVSNMPHSTVSLTRNKNLYRHTRIIPAECCIVIDGDKLSNRYRIRPYQWSPKHFTGKPATTNHEVEDQYEEEVQGVIRDLSKYVTEVVLFEMDLDSVMGDEETMRLLSELTGESEDDLVPSVDVPKFLRYHMFDVRVANAM